VGVLYRGLKGIGGLLPTQRQVDDIGAVVGRPDDAVSYIGVISKTIGIQNLNGQYRNPWGKTGHPFLVVGYGGDDTSDMGAMSVRVRAGARETLARKQ